MFACFCAEIGIQPCVYFSIFRVLLTLCFVCFCSYLSAHCRSIVHSTAHLRGMYIHFYSPTKHILTYTHLHDGIIHNTWHHTCTRTSTWHTHTTYSLCGRKRFVQLRTLFCPRSEIHPSCFLFQSFSCLHIFHVLTPQHCIHCSRFLNFCGITMKKIKIFVLHFLALFLKKKKKKKKSL
jgi:hypothetical protein